METDSTGTALEDEASTLGDLGEALADSDNAGQDTASPITGPASTASLDGLFHAGFLGWTETTLPPLQSGLSSEPPSGCGAGLRGDPGARSASASAADRKGGGEGHGDVASASRREAWDRGEGRFLRRDRGLPAGGSEPRGKWWLEGGSAEAAILRGG